VSQFSAILEPRIQSAAENRVQMPRTNNIKFYGLFRGLA
jgi:hypothetical protein